MNTVLTKARLTFKHVFLNRHVTKKDDLTFQQKLIKEVKRQKKSVTQHATIGVLITTVLLFVLLVV
ncbi:hypothetical protein [Aquibacillus albus]|uniref:Uncharacterized protein n=1 Tax=Aquibacillus albus TaxID=1168171 RepID=A0ABS2MY35_9BACI|nr:hypothetical protein [Aquibacillus albus]MBM7570751.1 hypothetical protein [Aquibacillus albus]